MGSVAFLFAGQGAQHPAMGVDLIETSPAAAEVFAIADEVRPGTSEQCRSASKEELSQTENTQPCVFVHDLAAAAALRERGVHFAASSGRRYDRLCEFFAPVVDKMDFVAANGAQVYAEGVEGDREVYSHLAVRKLARTVKMFPNMQLALFDRTKSFLLDDEDKFVREIDKDLPNAERIWGLPDPHVNIIKASIICDDGNVMDNAYVLQRELGGLFSFAPSGNAWIDAMQPGVSKASGIAQLMEHYGVERDEIMAFGDSMNDYEIIRFVGTGCAMENARPALKAVADRVVGCNRDHAVQQELRRVLESLA